MRLAHYSDIHVTAKPFAEGRLWGKRLVGALNYTVGGRGAHFEGSDQRIARLLEDIDEQVVDHALCTGDVTQMSYESEFARVAELYGARLGQPDRHTVIPGNHDRYTRDADAGLRFEAHLGALGAEGGYPLVKALPQGVTLVALDVARARPLLDSSGLAGPEQLERLQAVLTDSSLRDRFVVLGLHYGLLRRTGKRDRFNHRLRDDLALMALIERADVHLDLVLHGHMHRPYRYSVGRREVICVGSATDLAHPCGYHVYDIDPSARTLRTRRRVWDSAENTYRDTGAWPPSGPS